MSASDTALWAVVLKNRGARALTLANRGLRALNGSVLACLPLLTKLIVKVCVAICNFTPPARLNKNNTASRFIERLSNRCRATSSQTCPTSSACWLWFDVHHHSTQQDDLSSWRSSASPTTSCRPCPVPSGRCGPCVFCMHFPTASPPSRRNPLRGWIGCQLPSQQQTFNVSQADDAESECEPAHCAAA